MGRFKGTPGRWRYDPNQDWRHGGGYIGPVVLASRGRSEKCVISVPSNSAEDEANARAIAAVPQLIEALEITHKWLMEYMTDEDLENPNFNVSFRTATRAVRAALDAATKGE